MAENNRILTAAAVAAAGLMIAGGAAVANASTTPTPQSTSSSSAQAGAQQGPGAGARDQGGPRQMHQHTAVTGDELAKVKAAVQAKDASVTVSDVQKDPDGSYDVMGTKAGSPVMVEVSQDLKTVEVRTGGPGGRGGHGGMHQHTAVTGTEATKVKDAVKTKDATITIGEVRKDPDGSYDVMGTKAGSPVMVEVSQDLKTVEVRTGGPGGPGGHGGPGAMPGQSGQQGQPGQQAPQDQPTASASSAA
ncbi:hypothetical protein [Arsenicicoccus dermatophilus]|uniref:hypothetical protein n=1 Tax=Arsenicicoccus dermatophilus TaxID=1076331 RepID=UPI001F4C746B|nr:hypothetical protein [Arsenicicoccus dermatophilus]MCH8611799.1 hypothetical protein [Arsenicicoccus dermatophilus]